MSASAPPIQRGFEYEVKLAVSIPLAWASLLKTAAKHHYDLRCNEAGHHGVINGLYNTAQDSEWPSTYPVTWSDLDLTTKVAEQLEFETHDHELIRTIRAWLRQTMDAIANQRTACMELPGPVTADRDALTATFSATDWSAIYDGLMDAANGRHSGPRADRIDAIARKIRDEVLS